MTELARPRISVDEIELPAGSLKDELRAAHDVERHTAVGTEMTLSHRNYRWIGIDAVEARRAIHARKEPRCAVPGSGPQLKESSAGFRCRKSRQQGTDPRLGHHVEAERVGFTQDGVKGFRLPNDFLIVHRTPVRLTTWPFSGVVPSVSEDHVRCNGGFGSVGQRGASSGPSFKEEAAGIGVLYPADFRRVKEIDRVFSARPGTDVRGDVCDIFAVVETLGDVIDHANAVGGQVYARPPSTALNQDIERTLVGGLGGHEPVCRTIIRLNSVAGYIDCRRSVSRRWGGFNVVRCPVTTVICPRTRDRERAEYAVLDSADISASVAGYLGSSAARAWPELVERAPDASPWFSQPAAIEVDVLHAKFGAFEQPQPRTVHERRHQPHGPVQPGEQRRDLAIGRRVKSVQEAWANARKGANLDDFQLRDLRREAASRFGTTPACRSCCQLAARPLESEHDEPLSEHPSTQSAPGDADAGREPRRCTNDFGGTAEERI
jgi:hypothetical protein